MKIAGENVLHAPVEKVWAALLDPAVLVRTIPGCERLESTGEHAYAMTVTAGVASIRGTYAGSCVLTDLDEPTSLVMRLDGAGAAGTIGAEVQVRFADGGDGTTRVSYDADAVVGGMVGGVGQRMLTSVSRQMATAFFGNVDAVLAGTAPRLHPLAGDGAPQPAGTPAVGQVYAAPAAARSAGPSQEFLLGMAVGAGLVALGVLIGRRR